MFVIIYRIHRDTFGQIQKLKDQNVKAGGVAILTDNSRFIYYLVSKNDTYKKPTYQDLFLSLHAMKNHMVFLNSIFYLFRSHTEIISPYIHRRSTTSQNWPSRALAVGWMGLNGAKSKIS